MYFFHLLILYKLKNYVTYKFILIHAFISYKKYMQINFKKSLYNLYNSIRYNTIFPFLFFSNTYHL